MNNPAIKSMIASRLLAATIALLLVWTPTADAFFIFGSTSEVTLKMRFFRWFIEDFDTNRDGDVTEGEGIPMTVEEGPLGFDRNAGEVAIVEESFREWQNVPTSFVAFRFTLPITDPLQIVDPFGGTLFQEDGINLVFLQLPEDPPEVRQPDLVFPVLGIALLTFVLEDIFLEEPDGTTFPVTGARIIEADIGIEGTAHRPAGPGLAPIAGLEGTLVHEIGHILGMAHTPMNNLQITADGIAPETPVFRQRDATGEPRLVGVTPTMLPFVFPADDGFGNVVDGQEDLAPDDIAGVTFLYPRSSQNTLFTIAHEARTQSRTSIPSTPLLGGFVTAWADVDNSPFTPRVPLIGTMTGLLVDNHHIQRRGEFQIFGLPKVFEQAGAETFQATYTMTIDPLTSFRFPVVAPPGPEQFDSTHFLRASDTWPVPYDVFFPSETFFENGELFGSENRDAGTPLAWDPARRAVVHAETGKTLDRILPADKPMFGDASEVCPLNLTVIDFALVKGPTTLRNFRDNVLLQTAAGAALVDVYYQTGPAAVAFLSDHPLARKSLGLAMLSFERLLTYPWIMGVLLGGGAMLLLVRLRIRRRRLVAGLMVLATAATWTGPAEARIAPVTESQLSALSDDIIEGVVTAVDSELITQRRRVVTTVSIRISDKMKGRLNKDTEIFLELPFGRVGQYASLAPELPSFIVGEEVVLYLRFNERSGYSVVGGIRGKHVIGFDAETGEKYVAGITPDAQMKLKALAIELEVGKDDAKNAERAQEGLIPLETYKDYIRGVVREQAEN